MDVGGFTPQLGPSDHGMPAGMDAATEAIFSGAPAILTSDPYKNYGEMLLFYKDAKAECLEGRIMQERLWWRNLMYLLGRHWIYWDRKRGQWMDKRMAKWVPRPVTNKVAEVTESLVALFSSIRLETTARPVGGDVRNVATAETVDRLQPFVHEDHAMDHVMTEHDFWLVVTGNAFLHPFYDNNPQWGTIATNYAVCAQCAKSHPPQMAKIGVCPKCGGPLESQDVDLPIGKGRTIALSPFEIATPIAHAEFEDSPITLRMTWMPKRSLYNTYGKKFIENMKLTFGKSPVERSMQLLRALATQTDMTSKSQLMYMGESDTDATGTTQFDLWAKPCEEYPEGLLMRVLGDGDQQMIVDAPDMTLPGPLPFRTRQNEAIIPFIHTAFKPIGGKMHGAGPLDLICQKNDQLNRLDSLAELIVNRAANPVWLEPKGAEVKSFTGEPGLVVKYNPLASGGAKPERLEGLNIQGSIFKLREQIINDIAEATGTFDMLRGAKPGGVSAFSAMQLLVERGQARFATVFSGRGITYRTWLSIAIELERQFGPTKRTFAVMSPNRGWTFQHFMNADLQGAVEIIVEDGSQAPKTNLGKRAAIEQAKNLGFIDANDIEQRYTILRALGLNELMPTLDFHVKAALQEQDAFEQWAANPSNAEQFLMGLSQYMQQLTMYTQTVNADTVAGQTSTQSMPEMPELTPFQAKEYHDGRIHIAEHTKWANSDSARQIFKQFPQLEIAFIRHLELHDVLDATRIMRQQLAQTQAQARLGMLVMPQGQPGAAGGGGQALDSSNRESGNPADVPAGNNEAGTAGAKQGPQ